MPKRLPPAIVTIENREGVELERGPEREWLDDLLQRAVGQQDDDPNRDPTPGRGMPQGHGEECLSRFIGFRA